MSEPVERYDPGHYGDMIYEPRYGKWVEYSEYEKLKADNERLRQAVTYLCSTMEVNGIHDNGDIELHNRAIALGRAAIKEVHP